MIRITEEMREAINNAVVDGCPCILATASKDGQPGVGFRGSMMVFDDEHLAFWERVRRAGLDHILDNPRVVVMYLNRQRRLHWKLFGVATVYEDGAIRDEVMSRTIEIELRGDPERKGCAVVIRVDNIHNLRNEVLQSRD